jgi:hypothetical protein
MWQDDGTMRLMTALEEKKMKDTLREGNALPDRIFQIGEVLEVRGAWFRVQSINPRGMRLKAVRKPENHANHAD